MASYQSRFALASLPVIFGALALAGCPKPGPSSTGTAADVTGDPCEDFPAGGGDDHGTPWVPGGQADETGGGPLLDVGLLPDEEDPIAWELATQSGASLYYRSPTTSEMNSYGWTNETLLVVLPTTLFTTKVTGSQSTATAFLPRHDVAQSRPQQGLDITVVALSRQWSTSAMPYYERTYPTSGGATTTVLHPTLALYFPTGASTSNPPPFFISLVASSRGGIELLAGDEFDRVSLRGPFKTTNGPFALDVLPPVGKVFYVQQTEHADWLFASSPSGAPAGPSTAIMAGAADDLTAVPPGLEATAGKCADGLDNDPDDFADGCDLNCVPHADFGGIVHAHTATNEYSKDYALIGDLKFCSCEAPGIAEASLTMFALDASQILNNVQPPEEDYPMEVRAPPFRLALAGCLQRAPGNTTEVACQAARDCHNDNVCPGSLSTYPMRDYGNDYSAMRAQAWPVLDSFVTGKPAADVLPVHLAGLLTTDFGFIGEVGIKGLADFVLNQADLNGAFIGSSIPNGGITAGANLAHEMGHALGLGHEDDEQPDHSDAPVNWDGLALFGFMKTGNGQAPILNWNGPSDVVGLTQGQVWQLFVPGKFHPRASGFAFTGCDDDGDCQTGHPGLACCTQQCKPAPCP